MKSICGVEVIESINDFLQHDKHQGEFYAWQAEKSSDFINESDRAARCYDAAEHGCDGSTHGERIDDFREFGRDLLKESWRAIEHQLIESDASETDYAMAESEFEACEAAFETCVDDLEKWHIENGSYDEQGC